MKLRKIIILTCIGMSLFMLFPITSANAQDCYYCNPLLFPFAVVGAAVGTAAAIVTAPFCPYCGPYYGGPPPPPAYYSPPPAAYYGSPAPVYYSPPAYHHRVWIRGHYNSYGQWVPGHWRYRRT